MFDGLIRSYAEKKAASFLERAFGNYITTIAGALGILATATGQATNLVPAKYQPWLTYGGVFLAGVAAILAKDSSKTGPPAIVIPKGELLK